MCAVTVKLICPFVFAFTKADCLITQLKLFLYKDIFLHEITRSVKGKVKNNDLHMSCVTRKPVCTTAAAWFCVFCSFLAYAKSDFLMTLLICLKFWIKQSS